MAQEDKDEEGPENRNSKPGPGDFRQQYTEKGTDCSNMKNGPCSRKWVLSVDLRVPPVWVVPQSPDLASPSPTPAQHTHRVNSISLSSQSGLCTRACAHTHTTRTVHKHIYHTPRNLLNAGPGNAGPGNHPRPCHWVSTAVQDLTLTH